MDDLRDIQIGPGPLPAPRSILHAPKDGPWEKAPEAMVSFYIDSSDTKDVDVWVSFLFHAIQVQKFHPETNLLEVFCPLGILQISGPLAEKFWEGLRQNRVAMLKADGKGIESVHLHMPPKPKKKEEEF